jgi:hypothetical protein
MNHPIETFYKGYKFRSRLEARWAVFFDKMGIEFQYEPEGFKLKSGWYLPDFWLPQVNMWAEVKPNEFNKREYFLAYDLSESTDRPILMLVGEPDFKPYKSVTVKSGIDEKRKLVTDDVDIFYCLVSDYLDEGGFYYFQEPYQGLDDYDKDYKEAVYAARSERFD